MDLQLGHIFFTFEIDSKDPKDLFFIYSLSLTSKIFAFFLCG